MASLLAAIGLLLLSPAPLSAADPEGLDELPITDDDRDHWSFRPRVRPPLPAVKDNAWVRVPLDRFVLSRLERRGLSPAPEADRLTLIRRLSFDLRGLPPSPHELSAFVNDARPDAYERLVDRLLGQPAYGERWGQHWLDLARFADTDGFEHDKVREQAWRYRDWVIEAFNQDLPYDQFVVWQLAGDELSQGKPHIATAFCLSGPDMPDINSQEERRHNLLNEMTSTVGAVFLGLQIGCAQCHNHKYDPLSQADFYRLRAFFEPAVGVKKNQSVDVLHPLSERPVSRLMIRGDWRRPGAVLEPAFPRIANPARHEVPAAVDTRSAARQRRALAEWLVSDQQPLTARVIANRIWQHHWGVGLSRTPSDFGLLGDEPLQTDLLDWLACELVDQQWSLKRLHRTIVCSAAYRQASRPAAGEAAAWQARREMDPDNACLSRFPRRRLDAEALRDAMLQSAGVLNRTRRGPGVRPPLPEELRKTLLKNQWNVTQELAAHDRRSIYLFARRNLRYPLFDAFDRPDANASCPQRNQSTTAIQSLQLLNSEFALHSARRLAATVLREAEDRDARVVRAYQRSLGRTPTDAELRLARQFLQAQAARVAQQPLDEQQSALPLPWNDTIEPADGIALTDLCLALFNSNAFLFVD